MSKLKVYASALAALTLAVSLYISVGSRDISEARNPANAVSADDLAYLKDFDYKITELNSVDEAKALYHLLSGAFDTRGKSICANRAHVWSFELFRERRIHTGKVFIHFTPGYSADEDTTWAYHVAPYVIVNQGGVKTEYVLDPAFGFRGPITLAQWSKHFGKSPKCVELKPSENPKHLYLESNNVATSWSERQRCGLTGPNAPSLSPCLKSLNDTALYPSTPESTCYVRKTSMYYWMPAGYYGNDLYKSGLSDYSMYHMGQAFNEAQLIQACKNGISGGGVFKRRFCKKHLGLDID